MTLVDPHRRSFSHLNPTSPQRMAQATTVHRRSLMSSSPLRTEIVTIRDLGSDGIPLVAGPLPLALIPLSGALYLEWSDGTAWMDLNQLVLIPGGMMLRQRHADAGDVAYMSVSRPPDSLSQSGGCTVLPIGADLQREATRLATLITEHEDLSPAAHEEALRTILGHISGMALPSPSGAGGRSLTLVQRVRELVQETSTPRSLEEIAACVGASPVYLTSLFRQIEGMPIYRYQARLRLARSLRSLGETDDITTVAMDLGFANHSHFSTAFRLAFGLTPSAYKASLNIG